MPSDSEILAALTRAFARQFAVRLAPATLTEAELTLAERALETYTSEAWTWRR
jgi:lipoate-protein ligase A